VIKTFSAEKTPSYTQLADAIKRVGGVFINAEYTTQQVYDLLACCNAYVSLHRAEGFGLGMSEAMFLGKPVIATRYSGNLDFMSDNNSFLVDCHLRPITEDDLSQDADKDRIFDLGQLWAEPDVDHAARIMRSLYENQDEGRAKGAKAAQDIKAQLNPQRIGQLMVGRLQQIDLTKPAVNRRFTEHEHQSKQAHLLADIVMEKVHYPYREWHRLRLKQDRDSERNVLLRRVKPFGFIYRTLMRVRNLGSLWAAQTDLYEAMFERMRQLQLSVNTLEQELATLKQEPLALPEFFEENVDHVAASGENEYARYLPYLNVDGINRAKPILDIGGCFQQVLTRQGLDVLPFIGTTNEILAGLGDQPSRQFAGIVLARVPDLLSSSSLPEFVKLSVDRIVKDGFILFEMPNVLCPTTADRDLILRLPSAAAVLAMLEAVGVERLKIFYQNPDQRLKHMAHQIAYRTCAVYGTRG
jgi:hypothetical protein